MFLDRLQAPCAVVAAVFAAAGLSASTSVGAQPAPAGAASAPAAELTPNERAQRDADKVFKWILIHSDKPRKAGANRTDEKREERPATEKREERPAVAARAKPGAPPVVAATPSLAASTVRVANAPPLAAVAPIVDTQPATVTTASAPLAAVGTRVIPTGFALPGAMTADTDDEILTPLSRTDPKFPPSLLRTLSKGNVKVRFTVLPDGSVAEPAVVTSSDSRLRSAALAAVAQWRFVPLRKPQFGVVDLVFDFE